MSSGCSEPALINPSLAVTSNGDYRSGDQMSYWPSYRTISATCRANYLAWLADGRRAPDAYIGYVFLYFYGLERRLLADTKNSPTAQAETPALIREIERLLGIYGPNHSFQSYASSLLEYLKCREVPKRLYEQPAPPSSRSYSRPLTLRVALSQLATDGNPLPADWALSWLMSDFEYYPSTAAKRCRSEFEEIFRIRYAEAFQEGIRLRPTQKALKVDYHPATNSFSALSDTVPGLTEVTIGATTLTKLRAIATEASDSLDAYSRWRGRNADANPVRGIGLLPAGLVANRQNSMLHGYDAYLKAQVRGFGTSVLPIQDVVTAWDTTVPQPVKKQDAGLLAELLEKLGYGIDPDARHGKWSATSMCAVFSLDADMPAAPSPVYTATEAVVRLAAAVALADGHAAEAECAHMEGHLASVAALSVNDRRRLSARFHRLLAEGLGLKGIRKADLESYDEEDRRALSHFLLALAAKDGIISPAEITVLSKIYGLLGLDSADLYRQVHEATAGGRTSATEPVVVRPATPTKDGFSIPRPKPKPSGFVLNDEVLRSLSEDTARVSGLLAKIAAETETVPHEVVAPPEVTPDGGLDASHRALLEHLAGRDGISANDFHVLAGSLDLMAVGAIEKLNDAAMDIAGDLLLEEDGEMLLIQSDIYREMLS